MTPTRTPSKRFWLDLRAPDVPSDLGGPRLERALGVIYRPRPGARADLARLEAPAQRGAASSAAAEDVSEAGRRGSSTQS